MLSLRRFLEENILDSRDHFKKLDTAISLILLGMLCIMPLLPAKLGLGYEQIKVLFFLLTTTILSIIWIIASLINPNRFYLKKSSIHYSLILFLILLLLTAIFGVNLPSSMLGNTPYFQGFIVYLYCYLLFIFVSTLPIKIAAFNWVFITSSFFVSLWAIGEFIWLQWYPSSLPTYAGRVVSSFGQPNLFSGFLLLSLPSGIYLINKTHNKIKKLLFIFLIVTILGIVVSQSRATLLIGMFVLFIWSWEIFKSQFMRFFLMIVIVFLILLGGYSLYSGNGILHQELINPATEKRVGEGGQERRFYIWSFIVNLIEKRPVLGYGNDNLRFVFNQAFSEVAQKPPFYHTVKDLTVDRSHNYLLDLSVFGGLPLLFAWLGLFFILVKKSTSHVERFFLVLYFLWIQLQIQGIVHLVMFFVMAGIIQKNIKVKKEVL